MADISRGLVSYWKFDETSGTSVRDYGTNNYSGTTALSPTFVAGKIGNAISLNGSTQYISMGEHIVPQTGLTIAAWVNTNTTGADQTIMSLYKQVAGISNTVGNFRIVNQTLFGSISQSNATNYIGRQTGNIVPSGTWIFAVMTWDGFVSVSTSINLYLSGGNRVDTTNLENTPVSTPETGVTEWRVGALQQTAGIYGPFNGKIDEIRIYNRVLNIDEINAVYRYRPGYPKTTMVSC